MCVDKYSKLTQLSSRAEDMVTACSPADPVDTDVIRVGTADSAVNRLLLEQVVGARLSHSAI